MEKTKLIEVKNLKKTYGDRTVLKDVSFCVESGSIFGLIGHNGAGKTTLMTIMAGLNRADDGVCELNGKKVNYLPDVPGFFDYLSCDEYINFLIGGLNHKASRTSKELLDLVGLPQKARIGSMSRGMRQRLGIASVLVNDPDVLLLDEPTSALDPAGRMELLDVLKELRADGKAIMLSTHILADMEKVCDKVAFLHKGIICRQLDVADLKKQNRWIVQLSDPVTSIPSDEYFTANAVDPNTVVLEFNETDLKKGQKAAMQCLLNLDNTVAGIRNDVSDLDSVFQEVCSI